MRLAEALQERADLNRKIAQLSARLKNNALVQEGERPGEDPAELLEELNGCIQRLETLITQINRTNCETKLGCETLTAMLARKDVLLLRLQAYRELADTASQNARRATHSEIKLLSTVNVRELQQEADRMSKTLRELDNALQSANWQTELIED